MSPSLGRLSDPDLRMLATVLRSGRLVFPLSHLAMQRLIPSRFVSDAASEIESLRATGMTASQIAAVLDMIVRDRGDRSLPSGAVDLVTTGPDSIGANRDTGVVVRELFANATDSILIAGYAVYQGQKVFQALAERMRQLPSLQVNMFLDIQRPVGDMSPAFELVRRFAERFKRQQWPADCPIPRLFYDPRSLDSSHDKRACLHAKCVVVDTAKVLISSANFTEAAHLRNIEVGILINSPAIANQVVTFFNALSSQGRLLQVR